MYAWIHNSGVPEVDRVDAWVLRGAPGDASGYSFGTVGDRNPA